MSGWISGSKHICETHLYAATKSIVGVGYLRYIRKKGVGVTTIERIPTGIAEPDIKLSGGYPRDKAVLITGASGVERFRCGGHQ